MPFKKGHKKTGGKLKGYKAPHTLQAEVFRKLLIEEALKEAKPLISSLLSQAKKGNVQAIKEILDRILGKVKEEIELGGGELPIEIIIKKGEPKQKE